MCTGAFWSIVGSQNPTVHIHPEDCNCNFCWNIEKSSTFDTPYPWKPKFFCVSTWYFVFYFFLGWISSATKWELFLVPRHPPLWHWSCLCHQWNSFKQLLREIKNTKEQLLELCVTVSSTNISCFCCSSQSIAKWCHWSIYLNIVCNFL